MAEITPFQEFVRRRVERHHTGASQEPTAARRADPAAEGHPVTIENPDAPAVEQPGVARLRMSMGHEPKGVLRTLVLRHLQTAEGERWVGSIVGTDIIETWLDPAQVLILLNETCIARGLGPLYVEQERDIP